MALFPTQQSTYDKLKENGFAIKYTHPNLLFISWAHYIPPYVRMDYKKKTGISMDGFGNVKSNKKKPKNDNPNDLLLKDKPVSILKKSSKNDNYKKVSSYKPSGIIYNTELIKKIEFNVQNNDSEQK